MVHSLFRIVAVEIMEAHQPIPFIKSGWQTIIFRSGGRPLTDCEYSMLWAGSVQFEYVTDETVFEYLPRDFKRLIQFQIVRGLTTTTTESW